MKKEKRPFEELNANTVDPKNFMEIIKEGPQNNRSPSDICLKKNKV